MRTVTFQSVLFGVATMLGLDPRTNLQQNQAAALTEYITNRTREGWEAFQWPELCPIEDRAVTDNAFELEDDESEFPIGEVLEVWNADPGEDYSRASTIPFGLGQFGVLLRFGSPDTVWVEYRIRPSEFSADAYDATRTCAADQLVYFTPNGECYRALDTIAAGETPLSAAAKWQIQPMPYILSDYVKRAAYADALREDGQQDKAAIEESRALGRLEDEMAKIVVQQRQTRGFAVRIR